MSGEPAIEKVKAALKTMAAAAVPAATIAVNRPDDEPFGNAELPAIGIRVVAVDFEAHEQGATLHRARIEFDVATAGTASLSIDGDQSEMAAALVARIHADRTLGGLMQDMTEQSMSGTEDDGSEAGIAILGYEGIFLTPLGDHRTIIGATGLIP